MSPARRVGIALGAVALGLATFAPPAAALQGLYGGSVTRIEVELTQRLSSQDARAGEVFGFDTTSSVALDGYFLSAGTHGHGVVLSARSARGPQPGALVLAARSIDIPGGATLPVGLAPGQLDRRIEGDVRGFPVAIGSVPVMVGGERPTNVVYERGTIFTVISPPPPSPVPTTAG